jgi:ubiquitin-conjugating enzyme E2 variant
MDARTPRDVDTLQHNDRTGVVARLLSATFLVAAATVLALVAWKMTAALTLPLPIVVAIVLSGWLLADFLSGLLHWAADTWGRVDMPVVGRRLLHPFRVHHVNPRDILDRGFLDLNGDVAAVCLPFLALALWLPLDAHASQALALLLATTAGLALPTNQVHQWAHMPRPPRLVRALQSLHVVLSPRGHALHHANPAGGHYCITTGWCNRVLTGAGFYAAMERAVTRVTGWQPRSDPAMSRYS